MAAEVDQVREDMLLTVRSVFEGLSFQEKCGLLGVAPCESGLGVQTAAGPRARRISARHVLRILHEHPTQAG